MTRFGKRFIDKQGKLNRLGSAIIFLYERKILKERANSPIKLFSKCVTITGNFSISFLLHSPAVQYETPLLVYSIAQQQATRKNREIPNPDTGAI